MSFTVDYNAIQTNIMPEGVYEAIIKDAFLDVSKTNKTFISIPLVVRNDIEQPYKNAMIWHKLWKRKEPTQADLACGGYSVAQISAVSKAVGIPNGTQMKNSDDWFARIKGQVLRVTVKHGDEYNGRPNIEVAGLDATKNTDCKHVFRENTLTDGSVTLPENTETPFDDDDIVF